MKDSFRKSISIFINFEMLPMTLSDGLFSGILSFSWTALLGTFMIETVFLGFEHFEWNDIILKYFQEGGAEPEKKIFFFHKFIPKALLYLLTFFTEIILKTCNLYQGSVF